MYDKGFYDRCIKKYAKFAKDVIPILIGKFDPKSVIDIGCGAGMYIKEFYDKGIDVVGYEGSVSAIEYGLIPEKVILHDVRNELKIDRKFDLCLCVEVAEHVDEEKSDELMDLLCSISDAIIFTAAKPGQKGTGHVNCQNESYWVEKFKQKKFIFDVKTRDGLRKKIESLNFDLSSNFFYRNMMVFRREV